VDSSGPPRSARPPRSESLRVGTSVFDDETQAVARLDPGLLTALRRAATDAARDDVSFTVNSGWRSSAEQERLFRAAVAEYGSKAEAARWVARPGTSPHEAGDAVDLSPSIATTWLARHGAGYGLCQIYRNEPWHYELRRQAGEHGCPTMYADPTHDPRMRR
jgi:LAS superfamily LD-carboxypeptidase LdcB